MWVTKSKLRFFSEGRLGKKDSKPSTLQSDGFSGEHQLYWNNMHQLYSAFSIMDMLEAGIYFSTRTKRNVWNQGLKMINGDLFERTQYGLTIYLQSWILWDHLHPILSEQDWFVNQEHPHWIPAPWIKIPHHPAPIWTPTSRFVLIWHIYCTTMFFFVDLDFRWVFANLVVSKCI